MALSGCGATNMIRDSKPSHYIDIAVATSSTLVQCLHTEHFHDVTIESIKTQHLISQHERVSTHLGPTTIDND